MATTNTETARFNFRWTTRSGRTGTLTVHVSDDGRPFVDLADAAEERAWSKVAALVLETDFDLVSI